VSSYVGDEQPDVPDFRWYGLCDGESSTHSFGGLFRWSVAQLYGKYGAEWPRGRQLVSGKRKNLTYKSVPQLSLLPSSMLVLRLHREFLPEHRYPGR
jgi:hypothetical protein